MIDVPLLFLADLRDSDHLALIGTRRNRTTEQCLHPFGVRDPGRKSASDVVGNVNATYGDVIGEDQITVEKHADRRGSATHVDNGDAETNLVFYEAREPRRIGADNESLDLEM